MNILYVSSLCSQLYFDILTKTGVIKKLPQAQKFHYLIASGLIKIDGVHLNAISAYPTNRKWTKITIFRGKEEYSENIKYTYPFFINIFGLRQLFLFFHGFFKTLKSIKQDKNSIVICDALNVSLTKGALLASKLTKTSCIAIVTDVPGIRSNARSKLLPFYERWIIKIIDKLNFNALHKYDGFVFVTKSMNQIINLKHKPKIVIEGVADINMRQRNVDKHDNDPRILLYSGGVHKEFGLELLVSSFLNIVSKLNSSWELHIYGNGNYVDELILISSNNPSVKYLGVVPNYSIVEIQINSDVLINPRMSTQEFSKFSFPSKTLEYMSSGRPLISTVLQSMPDEYLEHIYPIYNESIIGFEEVLLDVLNKDEITLFQKGSIARDFILTEKNNEIQALKLYKFIKEEFIK